MKNRIIIIILGIILVISVCGNIFLGRNWADARGQVTVFSERVISADEQLNSLQEQLSDLEDLREQVADLNSQLENSESQVKALEATLSENTAKMEGMESTIEENNATIADLEEQLAEAQRKQQANTGNSNFSSNNNNTPVNPMPGPMFGENMTMGTGDGSGANGHFGSLE